MFVLLLIAIAASIYVWMRALRHREPQPVRPGQTSPALDDGSTRWSPIDDMQLTRLLQRAAQED